MARSKDVQSIRDSITELKKQIAYLQAMQEQNQHFAKDEITELQEAERDLNIIMFEETYRD